LNIDELVWFLLIARYYFRELVGNLVLIGVKRNTYRILVRKPKRKERF